MKITKLTETCSACPTQFSGETDDGSNVYIRFRFGQLRIDVDGESIYNESVSNGLDGVISLKKIKKLTKHLDIEWPECYDVL